MDHPFIEFVKVNEARLLDYVANTQGFPPDFNKRELRPLISECMSRHLSRLFPDFLKEHSTDGFDLYFHVPGSGRRVRISLKSMQQEVLQRGYRKNKNRLTAPKTVIVKNRLGEGTGALERNFDFMLFIQRAPSKSNYGFEYGIAVATFDTVREHSYVTNDQIVAKLKNLEWEYCSGSRNCPMVVPAEESNAIARKHLNALYDDVFDVAIDKRLEIESERSSTIQRGMYRGCTEVV
jgi:hypothetical protein